VAALLSVALAAGGGAVWLRAGMGMGGAVTLDDTVTLGAAFHASPKGTASTVTTPPAVATRRWNAAQRRSCGCTAAAAGGWRMCLTAAAAASAAMVVCGCGWLWRRQCKGAGDCGAAPE
jgi:hypothetical protein